MNQGAHPLRCIGLRNLWPVFFCIPLLTAISCSEESQAEEKSAVSLEHNTEAGLHPQGQGTEKAPSASSEEENSAIGKWVGARIPGLSSEAFLEDRNGKLFIVEVRLAGESWDKSIRISRDSRNETEVEWRANSGFNSRPLWLIPVGMGWPGPEFRFELDESNRLSLLRFEEVQLHFYPDNEFFARPENFGALTEYGEKENAASQKALEEKQKEVEESIELEDATFDTWAGKYLVKDSNVVGGGYEVPVKFTLLRKGGGYLIKVESEEISRILRASPSPEPVVVSPIGEFDLKVEMEVDERQYSLTVLEEESKFERFTISRLNGSLMVFARKGSDLSSKFFSCGLLE